jgi:hypothetical protein
LRKRRRRNKIVPEWKKLGKMVNLCYSCSKFMPFDGKEPVCIVCSKKNKRDRNKNGYIGVKKTKQGHYQAQVCVDYKVIHIGTYDTPEDAALAYDLYVKEYNLRRQTNFL